MKRNAEPTFRKCWLLLTGTTLILLCFANIQAAELSRSEVADGQYGVRETPIPLAARSMTQSFDPYTVEATSFACEVDGITTDNHYWRLFDLNVLVLDTEFCTTDIDLPSRVRWVRRTSPRTCIASTTTSRS